MRAAGKESEAQQLQGPLSCDEAILPGFIDTLADGHAYDLAESVVPDEDWYPFRSALLSAQKAYHADHEAALRHERLHVAARLCERIMPMGEGGEDKAHAALKRLFKAKGRGCLYLDMPEEGCLAVEAACLLHGREKVAEALCSTALSDANLPKEKRPEVAEVLRGLAVPAAIRLVALRQPPLPRPSVEAFRRKFQAFVDSDDGVSQAARRLRLELRDYPWITRDQVEMLLAELEGVEHRWHDHPVPAYWTQGAELPGHLFSFANVPEEELWRFQAAFDLSAVNVRTKDRTGPMPDRMVVQSVKRVENEKAWGEYVQRRSEIARERGQSRGGPVSDVEGIKVDRRLFPGQEEQGDTGSVCEEDGELNPSPDCCWLEMCGGAALPDKVDPGVLGLENAQELYLFHGTSLAGARCIAKDDFSTEFSSEAGMFGPGLYFAESAMKSDEYCQEEGGDLCTILVCRVCLGDHHHVADEVVEWRKIMKDVGELGRHSVLGDREAAKGTFREFITYDSTACYAEYVVRYRRAFGPDAKAARAAVVDGAADPSCGPKAAVAKARELMPVAEPVADTLWAFFDEDADDADCCQDSPEAKPEAKAEAEAEAKAEAKAEEEATTEPTEATSFNAGDKCNSCCTIH